MTIKVLIADAMSAQALQEFEKRSIQVTQPGKISVEELLDIIPDFHGIAIRSATKVDKKLVDAASKLKVVGRAGIGVDNVDLPACTNKGIVVMNTPMGNAITTAEHALSMMFSLARHIPQANQTTHAGKWAKSLYTGIELSGKMLGIIGSGNIGSIVATKALGIGLKVQAYDPYLTQDRANSLGIDKVELNYLLSTSDIVSLHVPKTEETENIIDATALNTMKKGAMLINCARGGLIDELALYVALKKGHLHGAALDVFSQEPAKQSPLFELDNIICTPHLGASTQEAQEKVAVQIAEQMADYLIEGSIRNAVNAQNLTAEELRQVGPYLRLAVNLGSFVGQLTQDAIKSITITYSGDAAEVNVKHLTNCIIEEILRPHFSHVNSVNVRDLAHSRQIHLIEAKEDTKDVYQNRITVSIASETRERSVSGAVINQQPRLVEIKGIQLESEFGEHMLYITNQDHPGMVAAIGSFAAKRNLNIANMHMGRRASRGDAISIIELDEAVKQKDIEVLRSVDNIDDACYLSFAPS